MEKVADFFDSTHNAMSKQFYHTTMSNIQYASHQNHKSASIMLNITLIDCSTLAKWGPSWILPIIPWYFLATPLCAAYLKTLW